jgi:hypothetical protein
LEEEEEGEEEVEEDNLSYFLSGGLLGLATGI